MALSAKDWYQITIPIHQAAANFNGRYNPAAEAMARSAQAGLQQELLKEAEKKREKQRKAGMWGDIAGIVGGPPAALLTTKLTGGSTEQALKSGAEAVMNNVRMAAGDPSGYATTALGAADQGGGGGIGEAMNASGGIPVMSPSGQKMGNVPVPTQTAASAYGSAPGRPNMAPPADQGTFAQSAAAPTAQGGAMSAPAYQAQTPPGGVQQNTLMQSLGQAGAKVGGVFGETGSRVGSEIFQRAPELLIAAQGMMGQESTIPELSSVYGLTPEQASNVYGTLQRDEMFQREQAQEARQGEIQRRQAEQDRLQELQQHHDRMKQQRDELKLREKIAKMENQIAKDEQSLAEAREERLGKEGSRQYVGAGAKIVDTGTGETIAENPYQRSVGGAGGATAAPTQQVGGVPEMTAGQKRLFEARIEPYRPQYQELLGNLRRQRDMLEMELNATEADRTMPPARAAEQLRDVQAKINDAQNKWIATQQQVLQSVLSPGTQTTATQPDVTRFVYQGGQVQPKR